MKLTRTRLLLKILLAASALGVTQVANAACIQQTITHPARKAPFFRTGM